MLQFFKKSGRSTENEEKITSDEIEEKELTQSVVSSTTSSSLHFDKISIEEIIDDEKEFIESRSRLSKNLSEIISDKNCICYFVQFLEIKNALPLIKFYLDAENFKTVSEFSLNKKLNEQKYEKKSELLKNVKTIFEGNYEDDLCCVPSSSSSSISKCDNELLSDKLKKCSESSNDRDSNVDVEKENSSNDIAVPELKNLCDLTMRKSLTDDEKSQIYGKKNLIIKQKQQKLLEEEKDKNLPSTSSSLKSKSKNNRNAANDSSSIELNTSIATDAVRIYKKYLTLNSQYFIDIPATISSNISLALCAQQISTLQGANSIDDNTDDSIDGANNISKQSITGHISSNCFEEAKHYIYERLEKEYLNEFLESDFYCKYCLDILTNFDLQISDILYNESALFYFMEYLEQDGQQNCLEFWMAATNFRKQYFKCDDSNENFYKDINNLNDNDDNNDDDNCQDTDTNVNKTILKEAQNDAMILYEKYFSLQAKNRLKFSDNVRSKIELNICGNNSITISKCFDLPLKIIEKYFEIKYFKNFIKSQLFTNYLNELRNKSKNLKLQSKDTLTTTMTRKLSFNKKQIKNFNYHRGHRKTMSDCTNENTKSLRNNENNSNTNVNYTISQQNTLLAMESNKLKTNIDKTASSVDRMQIETKYLTNPDLLWYRNSTKNNNDDTNNRGGLTFGRVNSLGRYERDFDLTEINEDNKWSFATSSSKIKNAVRKLVNLPEEKVQEEIAWQVAELIVKDITSITMGNNNNDCNNVNKHDNINIKNDSSDSKG